MANKAGKIEYAGRNSKGVVKLRRSTNQSLEEVMEFLDSKDIRYDVKENAYCINFEFKGDAYQYFWTTGRWGIYWNCHGNNRFQLPRVHYMIESIEDLYEKLVNPPPPQNIWQPPEEKQHEED